MPNTFKRKLSRNVGLTATTIGSYIVPANTQTTLIGLTCANVGSASIMADIVLEDSDGDSYHIVKDATVPIGGEQKVVMEKGDRIKVTSSDSATVDVIMSLLEIT